MAPVGDPEVSRVEDGRSWRIGAESDVAWIKQSTERGLAITSGVPPAFQAYATVVLPFGDEAQAPADENRHDQAVMTVLTEHTAVQPWWQGYLETGGDDIVFPDAPRVELYSQCGYVVIEAGPDQAATWRQEDSSIKGILPDLMFPADRSWLLSTLWDDDWICIGGSSALIAGFLRHPDLRRSARQVALSDQNATPPGHVAR